MPNIIAHALCANDVLQQLSDSKLKQSILKYPRVFSMASSGPDFLFYYKALPFQEAKDAKLVHEVGNVVHKKWINRFYQKAIELLKAETENKEVLTVFLAGHLMHWSLDHKAHPFVFNRSGEIGGDTKYWHYRFESMIDTMKYSGWSEFEGAMDKANQELQETNCWIVYNKQLLKDIEDEEKYDE